MRNIVFSLLTLSVLSQLFSCKTPYDPATEAGISNFLVVEGFINISGITKIQLSRTLKISEKTTNKYELGANLQIEDENNSVYKLQGNSTGIYSSTPLNLLPAKKYRLRIRTSDGNEYLSDFETAKISPVIDLQWERQPDGVVFSASGSDPQKNTNYYQWSYEETWNVRSFRFSVFTIIRTPVLSILERELGGSSTKALMDEAIAMYNCWPSIPSSTIITASTVNLKEDKIDHQPLVFIPNGSEKLRIRYSLLAKQYAISKEAYEFFQLMKKNSESLGSVFDPQPSQVRGNIKSITKPNQPVVGYIVAASASEKRIFIDNSEVPNWNYINSCGEFYVKLQPDSIKRYLSTTKYLLGGGEWDPSSGKPIGVYASDASCIDCRLKSAGERPSYW